MHIDTQDLSHTIPPGLLFYFTIIEKSHNGCLLDLVM